MPKTSNVFDRYRKASEKDLKQRIIGSSFGEVGCIAGDVPLVVRRQARHTRPILMSELYDRFNNKWAARAFPSYLQSFTDNETLFYNRIVGVTASGVKTLVSVSFDDGSVLRATPDHPVMTTLGFVEASSLTSAHIIIGRGTCRAVAQEGGKTLRPRRAQVNVQYHPYGCAFSVSPNHSRVKNHKTYTYIMLSRSRLVLEAIANNLTFDEYVQILRTDLVRASSLRFLPPAYEVHHQDENPLNDAPENLVVLTTEEHSRLHSPRLAALRDDRRTKRMKNIVSQQAEMTYDIQMAAPAHNFCAANTVVHNTLKTSFWLSAPGPIVVQSLDHGLEGVIEPFLAEGKDIYVCEYDANTDAMDQDQAIEQRDKFIEDYEHAVQHARTIIWDKETQVYELFKYAEFGAPSDNPSNYYPLFQRYRRLINMAKASSVNFGLIQGMRTPWSPKVNKRTGAQGVTRNDGQRERRGMAEIEELVHINIEHAIEEGEFVLKIGKSRGPGGRDIQNSTIPFVDFKTFATMVFPDSDEGDWI